MGNKIITLDDHFSTGEPTVQLVMTPGRGGRMLREDTSLHKTAAGNDSPALDYIKSVTPEEGKTIVLVIGLGDSETYGANRNGDAFPSEPVQGKIASDEVLTKHFHTYDNAHVFEHHVNHDPKRAIGRVKKAFWNPRMRRVEVLEDFDHKKAPHLLDKLGSGEFPSKSMGCAPAGELVHTPQGLRAIETLDVGDEVISHTGATRKITELHRRMYAGTLFKVYTSNGRSEMTSEHPYAVLPSDAVLEPSPKGGWRRKAVADIDTSHVHWTAAEALEPGMFLLTPFDTHTEETLTVDECRLLGYYCAEGHLHDGSGKAVVFTHHNEDALRDEVPALGARLGVKHWKQRSRANSAVAMDTELRSPALFALCDTHVGRLAPKKRLSLVLMQQPREQQLAFLGAMINGDGGTDDKDDFYISTCNPGLAHQLQHMGFRCGLYSRIQRIAHKPSALVTKDTVEHRVSFSRKGCNAIAPYCAKVSPRELRGASTGALLGSNFVISKITDISARPFAGPVFNFEVEGDNSYVVGNHAVHNCKVPYDVCTECGNRAPTRKQYCKHLKYEMNRINERGVKHAALNPNPRFFDSSWVTRPADRTGFMLKKVARDAAYEIIGSYELSDYVDDLRLKSAAFGKASAIDKVISGDPAASSSGLPGGTLSLVKKYSDTAPETQAPKMDASTMKVTIEYAPSDAVGTADAAGMPMGLRELIQYFMGRMGAGAPQEDVGAACKVAGLVFELFERYPRFYDDVIKAAGLEGDLTERVDAKLAAVMQDAALKHTPLIDHSEHIPSALQGRSQQPNTDLLTYGDAAGNQYQTTLGNARRTTNALEDRAKTTKYMRGAGYLGLGTLMAGAGAGKMLLGGRSPMNKVISGGLMGLGAASGLKGMHEGARSVRMSDLPGPKVMTDQGIAVPAYTEFVRKQASEAPEMAFTRLRRTDGACAPVPSARKIAMYDALRDAEIADEHSPLLGPTLNLEKTALILEQTILSCL